jgi:hypothetical protein
MIVAQYIIKYHPPNWYSFFKWSWVWLRFHCFVAVDLDPLLSSPGEEDGWFCWVLTIFSLWKVSALYWYISTAAPLGMMNNIFFSLSLMKFNV